MELLDSLKEYFKNTPRKQIEADWKKFEMYDSVGITADELVNTLPMQNVSNCYFAKVKYYPCDNSKPIIETDEIVATSLEDAKLKFAEIWHMNAEVLYIWQNNDC